MYCAIQIDERIRYFRNLRGWSQEKLALQAGINPAFLGHLGRGLKGPTVTTLEKIVAALDISLADLFAEETKMSDQKEEALKQVYYQIKDLPEESVRKIHVILQNILDLEKK